MALVDLRAKQTFRNTKNGKCKSPNGKWHG
ncbi:unnamed protein product, partial [Arabidopsis lyrata]